MKKVYLSDDAVANWLIVGYFAVLSTVIMIVS
jgi:hypothetical protein